MIDTNTIAQLQAAAPAMQSTLNAWHIVALGVGAVLTHAYHTVVNGGGIKRLAGNFWFGEPKP